MIQLQLCFLVAMFGFDFVIFGRFEIGDDV